MLQVNKRRSRFSLIVVVVLAAVMGVSGSVVFAEASAPDMQSGRIGCHSDIHIPGIDGIVLTNRVAPPAELLSDDCREEIALADYAAPGSAGLPPADCEIFQVPVEAWDNLVFASLSAPPAVLGLDPAICHDLVFIDLAAPEQTPLDKCPSPLKLPVELWENLLISNEVPRELGKGCPATPVSVDIPLEMA